MTRGEQTRRAVLAQATEIAARLGLAGLTIGSLATATGLSKSGLFAHFRSKEALQLATLAHAREQFIDCVVRPALTARRGEARVWALFTHWLACARDNQPGGCLFVSASTEYDDRSGAVREQLVRDHRDLLDTIAQVVGTAVAEGQFRPGVDADQFAHELLGVMLGYVHAHRLLADPAAEDRTRRAFTRLLVAARATGDLPDHAPAAAALTAAA